MRMICFDLIGQQRENSFENAKSNSGIPYKNGCGHVIHSLAQRRTLKRDATWHKKWKSKAEFVNSSSSNCVDCLHTVFIVDLHCFYRHVGCDFVWVVVTGAQARWLLPAGRCPFAWIPSSGLTSGHLWRKDRRHMHITAHAWHETADRLTHTSFQHCITLHFHIRCWDRDPHRSQATQTPPHHGSVKHRDRKRLSQNGRRPWLHKQTMVTSEGLCTRRNKIAFVEKHTAHELHNISALDNGQHTKVAKMATGTTATIAGHCCFCQWLIINGIIIEALPSQMWWNSSCKKTGHLFASLMSSTAPPAVKFHLVARENNCDVLELLSDVSALAHDASLSSSSSEMLLKSKSQSSIINPFAALLQWPVVWLATSRCKSIWRWREIKQKRHTWCGWLAQLNRWIHTRFWSSSSLIGPILATADSWPSLICGWRSACVVSFQWNWHCCHRFFKIFVVTMASLLWRPACPTASSAVTMTTMFCSFVDTLGVSQVSSENILFIHRVVGMRMINRQKAVVRCPCRRCILWVDSEQKQAVKARLFMHTVCNWSSCTKVTEFPIVWWISKVGFAFLWKFNNALLVLFGLSTMSFFCVFVSDVSPRFCQSLFHCKHQVVALTKWFTQSVEMTMTRLFQTCIAENFLSIFWHLSAKLWHHCSHWNVHTDSNAGPCCKALSSASIRISCSACEHNWLKRLPWHRALSILFEWIFWWGGCHLVHLFFLLLFWLFCVVVFVLVLALVDVHDRVSTASATNSQGIFVFGSFRSNSLFIVFVQSRNKPFRWMLNVWKHFRSLVLRKTNLLCEFVWEVNS